MPTRPPARSLLAALALAGALTLTPAAAREPKGGNCRTWFLDETVLSLHHAGCMERPSGLFQAAPGRCAKVARQAYRTGRRGAEVDAYGRLRGCLFDGERWQNASFPTAGGA